jgi:hypothetical protein
MRFGLIISISKMAAFAAIFVCLPELAFAEVCDKGDLFSEVFPSLGIWKEASPYKAVLQELLLPGNWIIVGLVLWSLLRKALLPAKILVGYLALALLLSIFEYSLIDMSEPYYQGAVLEGCVLNSPMMLNRPLVMLILALFFLRWQIRTRG